MNKLVKNMIYIGAITLVEVGVFYHYNHLLSASTAGLPAATVTATATTTKDVTPVSGVTPLSTSLMAVSDDGTCFAYVDNNEVLHAIDTSTGKSLYTLQLKIHPDYLKWIRNDSLFIGTSEQSGRLANLRLSTITLSTGAVRLIHSFDGYSSDAVFRNVTFSPYTNDVYVLISGQTSSVMFHYDTNGNLNPVDIGGRYVSKANATTTGDIVYFQDFAQGQANLLMLDSAGNVRVLQRGAVLLRVSGKTMYYGLLDNQGNVTQIDSYSVPESSSTPAGQASNGTGQVSNASGQVSSGTQPSGDGNSKAVLTLSTPTPPDKIYVTNEQHVLVARANEIDDLTGHKSIPIAADSQVVVRANGMILLAPDGTVTFER